MLTWRLFYENIGAWSYTVKTIFSLIFFKRRLLWHISRSENFMPTFSYWQKFINIIPLRLDPTQKQNPSDFTRNRKLPLPRLIVFILYLVSANKAQGVDIKSGQFFKNAKRSGLWPDAKAVHRSALSKARSKLPWHIFQELLSKAVCVAYQLWPQSSEFLWHGMPSMAQSIPYRQPPL
jgi:hypothetical protein